MYAPTPKGSCSYFDSSAPQIRTYRTYLWGGAIKIGARPCKAVRYDDIYRMDEIKSLSFHIMFYRVYRGVAKYIVSGNTVSSFE